ncbi:uncharacterized protein LOC123397715 isoform X2 [Hordeum vulgare subsp. vulgare]|uniref:uncharacterized protein LOC123397715 isoform X2 n=1 Tax=Hordeum vulgare subsp. vulgare TaxID=112509 RepID=UPI001D1A3808|nr:uncharacterized protein LOC123397715 isoform X2 [Hordeum vulgare subsp. vulgare]
MNTRRKKADNIAVPPKVRISTRSRMSNVNDMASLETNHTTVPREMAGHCVERTFELTVASDEGINLSVDLNSNLSEWIKIYSQQSVDGFREAQLEVPIENAEVEGMAVEDHIGCGDMLPVARVAEFKARVENEEMEEVLMEEEIGFADQLTVTEGTQLTLSSDKHESRVKTELVAQKVVMEEDIDCDDKLPSSNQVPITHANEDAGFTNHSPDEVLNHTNSMATPVDDVMEDAALESQIMEVPEKSGGVSENDNDEMNDFLQPILKIRDTILHKEHILQDQSAECDMDMHNILTEGKMTPKVVAIMEKYKGTGSMMVEAANPSCCGDGGKTTSNKRKSLKELLERNKCQELNEICCDMKCIPPRYTVLPSLKDGTFIAIVHFTCPGYDMNITGDPRQTPDGARCSAAANLITELHKKTVEEEQA